MAANPRATPARLALRGLGLSAVVAFIALLAYGLFTEASNTTIDEALAEAEPVAAPGFALAVLDDGEPADDLVPIWRKAAADKQVTLSELRGTPVVLNFWASWSTPCQEEAPVLARAANRWGQRGVLFIGLDMQDVREDAREFVAEYDLDFPHVRDPTKDTARDWGVSGIPETFFISSDGQVVGHVIGAVNAEQLNAGAAAARAGKPQDPQTGGAQRRTR